jgi:predicted RNA-binding protein with PIN domain
MAETTIVGRDNSKSLKSKYIDLPKMPVSVGLTMDSALEKLTRSGKESFRLQQLADAANAAIDKWVGAFQSSIDSVERKLPALGPTEAKDKLAELSDVLVKYAKQLEPTVDKAIEAEWKANCARNKALTVCRIKSRVKISIAVLTAGANVMSALSLVNVVANLAAPYHRESMEVFKHHERLADMMGALDDTLRSDVIGCFKDTAKGLTADVSPLLGRFVKSTKAAEIELESLRRKFVSAENASLVGGVVATTLKTISVVKALL